MAVLNTADEALLVLSELLEQLEREKTAQSLSDEVLAILAVGRFVVRRNTEKNWEEHQKELRRNGVVHD